MLRYFALMAAFAFLAFILSGCYDAMDVDDYFYVVAIGIDKGVENKLRLTLQFPTMMGQTAGGSSGQGQGNGSGGSGSQSSGYDTITVDAASVFDGMQMIDAVVPRRLSLMHAKFLVFSEELAREGIGEYLAPIVRYREIKRTIHVVVSKCPAMEFIKENKPYIGTTLAKSIELMMEETKNTGLFPHVTLNDLYDAVKSTYRHPMAPLGGINHFTNFRVNGPKWGDAFKSGENYYAGQMPRSGGGNIELFGCAVSDGDRMVGELDGEENRYAAMGSGEFKRGYFTIPDPKSPGLVIPVDVRAARKPIVKVAVDGKRPVINVTINLEGEILSVQSRIDYERPDKKPILEEAFVEYIKKGFDKTIKKCQALDTDIFRFGRAVVRHFNTIQQWEKYNWNKKFSEAEVKTTVKFEIRRTGAMMQSSPIISSKGKK